MRVGLSPVAKGGSRYRRQRAGGRVDGIGRNVVVAVVDHVGELNPGPTRAPNGCESVPIDKSAMALRITEPRNIPSL